MGNNISNTSDCDKFGEDDYYLDDDVFAAAFSRHLRAEVVGEEVVGEENDEDAKLCCCNTFLQICGSYYNDKYNAKFDSFGLQLSLNA